MYDHRRAASATSTMPAAVISAKPLAPPIPATFPTASKLIPLQLALLMLTRRKVTATYIYAEEKRTQAGVYLGNLYEK